MTKEENALIILGKFSDTSFYKGLYNCILKGVFLIFFLTKHLLVFFLLYAAHITNSTLSKNSIHWSILTYKCQAYVL